MRPPSPHPYQIRKKKKKLIVYDDKLGSALTVHTVPTRLARGQAWPGARTTITNTGHASQEGVGAASAPSEEVSEEEHKKTAGMWLGRGQPPHSGEGGGTGTRTQIPDSLLRGLPLGRIPRVREHLLFC